MAEPVPPAVLRERLRSLTPARVGLGRVGAALPTSAMLEFQLAHARARDAVRAELPRAGFGAAFEGGPALEVHSRAKDRTAYLQRPDLGRRLDPADRQTLTSTDADVSILVGDGLSANAVLAHAQALVSAIRRRLSDWRFGPLVLARQARVALGDEVGEALGVALIIVLIGERPGLTTTEGLGAYLTWAPRIGRRDSERNCVSNIGPPHGLDLAFAAEEIAAIARRARREGRTGVSRGGEIRGSRPPPRLAEPLSSAADPPGASGGGGGSPEG